MQLFGISNNNPIGLQFKARFSQKDITTLMKSAEELALAKQEKANKFKKWFTGTMPEKTEIDAKTMYGQLNAILDYIDTLKGQLILLVEENISPNSKNFKIMNEKHKILGTSNTPIKALYDAFILDSKYEQAPKFCKQKLPSKFFYEKEREIGDITEKDVLTKAYKE